MRNKIITILLLFAAFTLQAQEKTMYIMKNGNIVKQYDLLNNIDSVAIIDKSANFDSFIDARDNTEYKTVLIGRQEWMAENLKYLPTVSAAATGSPSRQYNYVYGYNGTDTEVAKATTNYQTYGALYNWPAAMVGAAGSNRNPSRVQGICPEGWHLPSDKEWEELENYLIANGYNYDGSSTGNKIALSMAVANTWRSSANAGVAGNSNYPAYRNLSGYSALPGGWRTSGSYDNQTNNAYWWSATESNKTNSRYRGLSYNGNNTNNGNQSKEYGASIRCVKDYDTFYALTLNSVDETLGTVKGEGNHPDGVDYYIESEVITIRAIPDFGYTFTHWTGNIEYIEDAHAVITQLTMPGKDISLTAHFEEADYYDNMGSFIDDRDNTVYNTIKIGNQWWMAENLKYLPEVSEPGSGSTTEAYYYVYDYYGTDVEAAKITENYKTYGVLYNWPAAMFGTESSNRNPSGVQGICPEGWHLPSDAEWRALEDYLTRNGYNFDGTNTINKIAISMANPGLWSSNTYIGSIGNGANYSAYQNKSGFSALPGGGRSSIGYFYEATNGGYWWSSTENSTGTAYYRRLIYFDSSLYRNYFNKADGFSVRCVRD